MWMENSQAPAVLGLQKQDPKSDSSESEGLFLKMNFVCVRNTQCSKYHVCFRWIEHDMSTGLRYPAL